MKQCSVLTGFPLSSPPLSKSTHFPLRRCPDPDHSPSLVPSWSATVLYYLREPLKSAQGPPCSHLLNPLLLLFTLFPRCHLLCPHGPFYLISHSCDLQSTELVGLSLHFVVFLPPTHSFPKLRWGLSFFLCRNSSTVIAPQHLVLILKYLQAGLIFEGSRQPQIITFWYYA